MIEFIAAFAVHRRWLILGLTAALAGLGVYSALQLPVDALPDITNVQVQINTAAPGYSPLEAEQRVTFPIETAMAGLPRLDYTRSLSRYGLSQVTVVFAEGTDLYFARQLISERLQTVRDQLPQGLAPELGPLASGLGEITLYSVEAEPDARQPDGRPWDAESLRTLHDWVIRPQLLQVKGITEVNAIGGHARQYEVAPDPEAMLARGIGVQDLVDALARNNLNVGAGYLEQGGEQWLVRLPGQIDSLDAIANTVVALRAGSAIRVGDLAQVHIGHALRTGAATRDGEETVLGTAVMLLGENSREVAKAASQRLAVINRTLPAGVTVHTVYDRTTLVDKTIATVERNLFEGAVLVIAVLFALLGNLRAALITAMVIPLSLLFAMIGMSATRTSGNLMSLGAIDFGLIVDGAVIVVENSLARLALAQQQRGRLLSLDERLATVRAATREVFRPASFGVLIIMVVYLPIFALTGVEGKMFQPMALTVIAALLGALLLTITAIPAAIAVFVRGPVTHQDNRIMRALRAVYAPALDRALRYRYAVLAAALLLVIASGLLATRLGAEFVPHLDEGDIALHALRIPGTSLSQSVAMQREVEKTLLTFPQVETVFARIGTAEVATDPMPPSVADTFVMLKAKQDWPDPTLPKTELVEQMAHALQRVPGNNYEFTQPIQMRFNELIAGVRADVALRIYGDDLDELARLGEQAERIMKTIDGAADTRFEPLDGLPVLTIIPDRALLGRLGLDMDTVQTTVRGAIAGIGTGLVFEGDKRFPLVVRMADSQRRDIAQLQRLPIPLADGGYIPLGEIATLEVNPGPNQVNRERGKRNALVGTNVRGRDLGSYVAELQQRIQRDLPLPAGYWVGYGGSFEQLQSASRRLALVVPLALGLIFALLYGAFGSARDAVLIFSAIPLALCGGVLALWLRDIPLSISAGVGFIALSGIAVLNGVVMLSHIKALLHQRMPLEQAIRTGALRRLRPVLMTALVAGLGFVPMAFLTGIGSEVQRPLATVVVGGILSATLLTLLVLPALYRLFGAGDSHGLGSDV